ncbi:hypothetical protein [Thalassotalea montiporae]
MSNIIPKTKGERYTFIFGLIFSAFILYWLIGAVNFEKTRGLDEFNESMSNLSKTSKYYLFERVTDVYEDKFYKSGVLGEEFYNCLKNSYGNTARIATDYKKIYLRLEQGDFRSYFVLNVYDGEKILYATLTGHKDGEYGFRSIRYIGFNCNLELTSFN